MGKWLKKLFGWLFGKKSQETVETKPKEEETEAVLPDNENIETSPQAQSEPAPEAVPQQDPVGGSEPTAPETHSSVPDSPAEEKESSVLGWEMEAPVTPRPPLEVTPPQDTADTSFPPVSDISPFEDSTAGIHVEPTEVLRVHIQRYSYGQADTLGRLLINGHFCCFTLEGVNTQSAGKDLQCIPPGQYALGLRKSGGKHATYYFRHRDIHQGMLWIQGVEEFEYAQIHEGNTFTDIPGSVIVGEQPLRENQLEQKRELWYSEHAYREIYPLIANHIHNGGVAILSIN